MLPGYVLSVATFRVIARDSMSPSFQSFLSGPPCFSSVCTSQHFSSLLCAFLPAFCPRWSPAASCRQPGVWPQVGLLVSLLTHSEHCWGTSCWAGPWPAASTGSSLPAGIHGLMGEADIVSVYSDLHSQSSLTCSPSPLPCFYFFNTPEKR